MLQPILGAIHLFIKKSKQFYQSNIASDIAALALTLSVNEPLIEKFLRHLRNLIVTFNDCDRKFTIDRNKGTVYFKLLYVSSLKTQIPPHIYVNSIQILQ